MRVLILALLAGCYSPSIDDCQFRCSATMDCPDGTDCANGFCRTSTGACPMSTGDASNPCPANTPQPPSACTTRFALENGGCGILCATVSGGSERSWAGAVSQCMQAGWQLAVLDTVAKLDAVPQASDALWVGALRMPLMDFEWLSGDPIIPESWSSGAAPQPTQGQDCGALGTSKRLRNDLNCNDSEAYVCTYPPR